MSETATVEREWFDGRNGGRLLRGGVGRGPNRATTLVRQGIVAALNDPKGGKGRDFWLGLKCGSAEDRRCFATIASRLIPVEVQGDVGETLKITINTLVAAPHGEPVQMPIRSKPLQTLLARARLESTSSNDAPSVNVQPTALPTVLGRETQ